MAYDKKLLEMAQRGEPGALDRLISENAGLVRSIAARFTGRGTDFDDLIQIGTIGMIKAVRCFDFTQGTVFSTYAVPLIIGEIRRFLRDDGLIKVGRTMRKNGSEAMRARERFIAEQGREPRLSELADLCGLEPSELCCCLEAAGPVKSLHEPIGDEDGCTLEAVIEDKACDIERLTDRVALAEAIAALPVLWQKIIELRYFRELSQQQTGSILGLTQVKISREEKKILTALREAL